MGPKFFVRGIILKNDDWHRISNYGRGKEFNEDVPTNEKKFLFDAGTKLKGKYQQGGKRIYKKQKTEIEESEFRKRQKWNDEGIGGEESALWKIPGENIKEPKPKSEKKPVFPDGNQVLRRFCEDPMKPNFEKDEAMRSILSGAALSAILYERNNQVKFNEEHKSKGNLKEPEISKVFVWPERIIPDKYKVSDSELKEVLNSQMREHEEMKEKIKIEKAFERDIMERKMNEFVMELREERERARLAKLHKIKDIKKHLQDERRMKIVEKKLEEEEEQLRDIYNKVSDSLEIKKKIREIILDSKAKKEGVRKFIMAMNKCKKDLEMEQKKIQLDAMEIDRKKSEELALIKSKREELMRELVRDREKAEEEMKRKQKRMKEEREMEINEKENRTKSDKIWNERLNEMAANVRRKIFEENLAERDEKKERKKLEKLREKVTFSDNYDYLEGFSDFVLKEAELHKRPLFPVLSTINKVKLKYGKISSNKRIDHLLSNLRVT